MNLPTRIGVILLLWCGFWLSAPMPGAANPFADSLAAADRTKRTAETRQLGMALMQWAVTNNGAFPPKLEALVQAGIVNEASARKLLYLEDGKTERFTYHPGLSTSSDGQVTLLEETHLRQGGRTRLRIDLTVQWVKTALKTKAEAKP